MKTATPQKPDRTVMTVRIGLDNATALHEVAKQHGFRSRNAMLKQLSIWAINARPEDFQSLGLQR